MVLRKGNTSCYIAKTGNGDFVILILQLEVIFSLAYVIACSVITCH